MKARDIFGIVVRTFGLLLLAYSLYYLAWAVAAVMESHEGAGHYFTQGIPFLALGVLLFGFSRYIVRLSYPRNRDDSED